MVSGLSLQWSVFRYQKKADEMDDTARGGKHAAKLIAHLAGAPKGNKRAALKPEEIARRLRIGKLYHEFEYFRWRGSPSKRDQFLKAHPDCVLGVRLMTKAVAAYKKQAEKQ